MKRYTLILMTILGASMIIPVANRVSAESKRDNVQDRVDQVIENRCDRVTERVDTRISRYEENKDKHITRYNKIKENVTNLINKLESKGYDLSKLKEDLTILNLKIQEFASSYTIFIDKLAESKGYACGDSEGQFRSTIEESINLLKEFRQNAEDIIDFVKSTIKPNIEALRNQDSNS